MHSLVLINLCVYLLFYNRVVSSSGNLFSRNERILNETFDDVLQKFVIDLDKVHLQKCDLRHLAVVGASNEDFQQVQPLLKRYPYSVCKGSERCVFSQQCTQRSFVLVFLVDLRKERFEENIKILSLCRRSKVLFVSNGMIQVNDVRVILTLALQYNVPDSKLTHVGKNVIQLYSDTVGTNCTMEVQLVTVWRPGMSLEKINGWIIRTRDMNKCPVSISSMNFTPKMMIQNHKNGTYTVIGGRDGNLLLAIAEKLNFTIKLRYPSIENQQYYSKKEAIFRDVDSGISEIGIGRLRPFTNLRRHAIALSFPYDNECITWSVPRVIRWSNNITWVEFSGKVWLLVGLVFTLGCIIAYVHINMITTSKAGQRTSLKFDTIFLNAIALHLGNPVLYASSCAGARFMLITYLYYAMVITTAYRTSLAPILATDQGTPTITDAQGIINAGIKVSGLLFEYNILADQVNESKLTAELLKRFVIDNNSSEHRNRMLFRHDYAILARRSYLDYVRQNMIKAHKPVTYDVLDDCVLSHPSVIVFQTKSFLHIPANYVILRLTESGILQYWDGDGFDKGMQSELKIAENYSQKRAVYKFWNIFILYSVCASISLFTFLIELLLPRLY